MALAEAAPRVPQALDEGENEASSVTPNGFTGGSIVYTDGAGATFQWKVPATDSGPELAALKKGMEGNY
jgi:hypothetical protein